MSHLSIVAFDSFGFERTYQLYGPVDLRSQVRVELIGTTNDALARIALGFGDVDCLFVSALPLSRNVTTFEVIRLTREIFIGPIVAIGKNSGPFKWLKEARAAGADHELTNRSQIPKFLLEHFGLTSAPLPR